MRTRLPSSFWLIPVGAYAIGGTKSGGVIIERSFLGSRRVSFPWTFHPYTRMQAVATEQVSITGDRLKGMATAELVLTDDGWKVESVALAPLRPD